MRTIRLVSLSTALILAQSRHPIAAPGSNQLQANDRVEFRAREAQSTDSLRLFEAEYSAGGKVARFAFTFHALPPASSDISFIEVGLLSRPGSDPSVLLA